MRILEEICVENVHTADIIGPGNWPMEDIDVVIAAARTPGVPFG